MSNLLRSSLGRFRLLGFLEGGSLLLLVFVAMPFKYLLDDASWVKTIGPVHGILFMLYIIETLRQGGQRNWKFWSISAPLLAGSFLPFGTFIADYRILRVMKDEPSEV